jgi:hypothetical protein
VGENAVLRIELDGELFPQSTQGYDVPALAVSANGAGSTIRGLVINHFAGDGKAIELTSNLNTVVGCFIGTNPAGTAAVGNGYGIAISLGFGGLGGGNRIGTPAPADRNVISGNGSGINIYNSSVFTNTVQNNYIGVDAGGNTKLGNYTGIVIGENFANASQGATLIGGTAPGSGNVISGSDNDGVFVSVQYDTGVLGPVNIQGNIIGLGVDGTTVVGNRYYGIEYVATSLRATIAPMLIGGTSAAARNIISGNGGYGIEYAGTNTTVQGNFIGTDITGTLARGNVFYGIGLTGDHRDGSDPASTTITIGGTAAGAGNVISGNLQDGINSRFAYAVIQGNRIGTQADGTSPLGNGQAGITVLNFISPVQITVGGLEAGAGNIIAYNATSGVSVGISTVTILRNSMFNNGPTTPNGSSGLGIDLGGLFQNDAGDADTGPNGRQNFPILTSISSSGGTTSILGTLNSVANQTYRIEFFANDSLDPSGYGEGKTFAGTTSVTTDANGNASFNVSVPQIPGIGLVTSTATDPNGNTSEFSPSIGRLLNISTRLRVQTGDNVLIGGFIVTGTDPKKVIVRGIGPSLINSFVQDPLADPTIELHDANGATLASNDNWKDSQQEDIRATGVAPTDDRESAIVTTLAANNSAYTAIVRGKDNSTGVALVEVFDLDQAAQSRLANISTRGFVETGDSAMIGGFILGGGSARVMARAIGPSLPVSGKLADPTLELHNPSVYPEIIATNDNWRSSQEAEIIATTIPPSNDLESAIVTTLVPGSYTAVVRGVNSTTGVALVEVFGLQ